MIFVFFCLVSSISPGLEMSRIILLFLGVFLLGIFNET